MSPIKTGFTVSTLPRGDTHAPGQPDNMTSLRCLECLLFLLSCHVYGENPEPTFRARGSAIEMGYCFGVDYILVYRVTQNGDELLGNSSESVTPVLPPADLQGRIQISKQQSLLGLQIRNLTQMDSAVYRKECWQSQTLVSHLTQKLFVCDEEVEAEEITVKEEEAGTELLCNSTSTKLEGTFVRWYHEMYPSYKLTLLLDSSVSLEPLAEELRGLVEVKDKAALLVLDNRLLKHNQQFYCLVIKGKSCLSLQNMYLPDNSESREIYASEGERMVLHCSVDGHNQHWQTPLGRINGSSMEQNQMYIRAGDKDFSLVIPSVSDEHSGEYSCISSNLEMQYSLVLCPIKTPLSQRLDEGQNVMLKCDADKDDQRVQWYHRRVVEQTVRLIYDSHDGTVPVPEYLNGRLSVSESGSSLTISNLELNDGGVFACVALGGPGFIMVDYYEDDYDEEDAVDHDFSDDQSWNESEKCLFKQDTCLTVVSTPKSTPTAGPPTYVVAVAVLVAVLLVGAIVAVIVLKMKDKQRKAAEQNTNKDINNTEDPSCARMLPDNKS